MKSWTIFPGTLPNYQSTSQLNRYIIHHTLLIAPFRFWDCVHDENSILSLKDHLYLTDDVTVTDMNYSAANGTVVVLLYSYTCTLPEYACNIHVHVHNVRTVSHVHFSYMLFLSFLSFFSWSHTSIHVHMCVCSSIPLSLQIPLLLVPVMGRWPYGNGIHSNQRMGGVMWRPLVQRVWSIT